MKVKQNIWIWKNGILVDKGHNTIRDGLKSYLIGLLDTASDSAIDSLFNNDGVAPGGAQDGNDGIVVLIPSALTMVTTSIAANHTYGKRWQGVYTNESGGVETAGSFVIGHDLSLANDPWFDVDYADYDPTDIGLQDQDTLVLEWEVYITG